MLILFLLPSDRVEKFRFFVVAPAASVNTDAARPRRRDSNKHFDKQRNKRRVKSTGRRLPGNNDVMEMNTTDRVSMDMYTRNNGGATWNPKWFFRVMPWKNHFWFHKEPFKQGFFKEPIP